MSHPERLAVSPLRPLPEAFILGAMRAGTTFLHAALCAHPGVARAKSKELQFFSLDWEKGLDFYSSQMPVRWPSTIYSLAGRARPIVVDATPYYLFHPESPMRLRAAVGTKAKCIILLRDPTLRAWSHYNMMLRLGWEHLGLRDALAREAERTVPGLEFKHRETVLPGHLLFSYVARGYYAEQLLAWWKHLPRENFLVLRSEDLFADPQSILGRVCDFLELQRIALSPDLPRNQAPYGVIPSAAGDMLGRLFEDANRRLYDLTGISWRSEHSDEWERPAVQEAI